MDNVKPTSVSINLDEHSVKTIKKVNSIHRDSLINIGIAMVAKTPYYKTLLGVEQEDLDEVASLDMLDEENETTTSKKSKKKEETKTEVKAKPTSSWDSF